MKESKKKICIIDRSIGSVREFLKDVKKFSVLSKEREYELWEDIQHGNKHARDELINHNLRHVVKIAIMYMPSRLPMEDLMMAGSEGITKAADKFDARLGYHFISFADMYIKNEIHKAAYDFIKHNSYSLDEPVDSDDEHSAMKIDLLTSDSFKDTDWDLRFSDMLTQIKNELDSHMLGAGKMFDDLYDMILEGYTLSDFARKYNLTKKQQSNFLDSIEKCCHLKKAA